MSKKTTFINGVDYEICEHCGKPKRGTGRKATGFVVWVTKNYIQKGKEVDFTSNWQQLCIQEGFELVEEIRAMVVKSLGVQGSFVLGEEQELVVSQIEKKKERKSFFRRLAEANAKAREHWKTLQEQDQQSLIMESYTSILEKYLKSRACSPPTITRVISLAQKLAWVRDGKPEYEIEINIDWETITIMRKPLEEKDEEKKTL
jgi:hypothetical protein